MLQLTYIKEKHCKTLAAAKKILTWITFPTFGITWRFGYLAFWIPGHHIKLQSAGSFNLECVCACVHDVLVIKLTKFSY